MKIKLKKIDNKIEIKNLFFLSFGKKIEINENQLIENYFKKALSENVIIILVFESDN